MVLEQLCHILGGGEGKGRDTGEPQSRDAAPPQAPREQGPARVAGPCPLSFRPKLGKEEVRFPAASEEKVGLDPRRRANQEMWEG